MPVVSCRPRTPRPAFCLDSDLRAQPSTDRGLARKLERAMESTSNVAVTASQVTDRRLRTYRRFTDGGFRLGGGGGLRTAS